MHTLFNSSRKMMAKSSKISPASGKFVCSKLDMFFTFFFFFFKFVFAKNLCALSYNPRGILKKCPLHKSLHFKYLFFLRVHTSLLLMYSVLFDSFHLTEFHNTPEIKFCGSRDESVLHEGKDRQCVPTSKNI